MSLIPRLRSLSYTKKTVYYLIVLAAVLLIGASQVSLWDQDEAAYAGFARNMFLTGDWLIPKFLWSEVHRKPPLHFWNIALSYKLFGVRELAVRFPSILAVIGTLGVMYGAGRTLFGDRESWYAVLVLSTTFLVMSLAEVSVTDATVLFFNTVCALAMLHVLLYRSGWWVLVFWTSFALCLLTKGPPVILFTGAMGLLLLILHPNRWNLLRLHPWFLLPVSLLPLLYWGYLCTQQPGGPAFISWMLDWYIFKRVSGSVFGQTGPPGTHLLGILLFFLPYLAVAPTVIIGAIRQLFKGPRNTDFLLAAWFVGGWFIFELSPSKLPAYVVQAHVPLAFLVAKQLISKQLPSKSLRIAQLLLNGLLFIALILLPFILNLPPAAKGAFSLIGLAGLVGLEWVFSRAEQPRLGFLFGKRLLILNVLFQAALWAVLLPLADDLKNSSLRVARYVEQTAAPNSLVIIANDMARPPSLPFYLTERFPDIGEVYDPQALAQLYERTPRIALILNAEQHTYFKTRYPALTSAEIKPFFTDRIRQDGYFVVVKK